MKQFTAAIMLATLGAQAARVLDNVKPYISGEIQSKETFLYGRFKTRIQGSDRRGTLASFLTLFTGNDQTPLNFENWNHINLELKPH
jgi:beta-glucanase (GH16 family)